ncbi:MAG: hypothetical protein COB76_02345 [Alphaproteobacteria bacterium]|nr:MAG: hypothetical protein COB76_02345 [Alphaproteobacteria bacterium]
MIETFLFVLVLYLSLWMYFSMLDVMNFKKDPNEMEEHLPGRPARRTIGRKNDDVSKSLLYILVGHMIVATSLYGVLDYKDFLPTFGVSVIACAGLAFSMSLFSPANRLIHAYVNLGHIAVTHVLCGFCAFIAMAAIFYGYTLEMNQAVSIGMMSVGVMLCFGAKPRTITKKKKKEEELF